MPTPVLPLAPFYDGIFVGPTVVGASGSTSGAADQTTLGQSNRWVDLMGDRWFVSQNPPPPLSDNSSDLFCDRQDSFPYAPLVRPASEAHGDQRVLLSDFFGSGNHGVLLRYRDAAAYIPLAFYLVELRFDRLRIRVCRSGYADALLLEHDFGFSLNPNRKFTLDCAAIRTWPTRLFAILTDVTTSTVISDHVVEDSTADLQVPGVVGLAQRSEQDVTAGGPDGNALGGVYRRVRLFGADWHNQPVIVYSARANPVSRAKASIVLSAQAFLPRLSARVIYSARAGLPRCNASIVLSATADASASVVLPHTYAKSSGAPLVFTASAIASVPPGVHAHAAARLTFSATADCRIKHRHASASIRYHASVVEHSTVRPVACAAPLTFRARARARLPAVLPLSEYLGRFQVGTSFTVLAVTPRWTAWYPEARVYDLDGGRLVEALGLYPTRHLLVYFLAVTLGALYRPGRYTLVYNGLPGVPPAVFEVTAGGDPAGAVIAAHALGSSSGSRLVAQLDSGVLLVGARPDLA